MQKFIDIPLRIQKTAVECIVLIATRAEVDCKFTADFTLFP